HRGNNADFAAAITVAPAVGDFAEVVRRHLFERPAGIETLNNFVGRYDFVQAPAVGVADIHEFDEAQDVTAIAEMFGHGLDAVIIGTALDDHIDLDRVHAGGGCVFDAGKHFFDREADVVNGLEGLIIQGIQTDG